MNRAKYSKDQMALQINCHVEWWYTQSFLSHTDESCKDESRVSGYDLSTVCNIFSSIKPELDIGLFLAFCVFSCFYQFLHDVIIKLFLFGLQNNFMITSCNNMWKKAKTGKNTEISKQSLAWLYKIWTCLIFIKQLSCILKWNYLF